jgi:Tfp pilus assembly major pilin PilA
MGASVSKNTAEAMASVTNTVDNSTTVTNNNITAQANEINLNECFVDVKNSINIKQYAEQLAKNKQITQGMSNTDLKNDIQQKMMQEAMSSVGSMGIGYANASNSASMFASATSTVTNAVADTATNIANSKNQINCNDSVIRAGNIDINQGLSNEYSNDQVAKSDNVTKIATTISQTAQQKATAKVAGLGGFLIALAILIVAMGWSFSEVAESVPGVKAIVLIIAFFLFVAILLILYVYKVPPLFNDPL